MDSKPTVTTKKKFSIICLVCGESATIEETEDENSEGDLALSGCVVRCTACDNSIWSINNGEI